jgi:hypothetical protein
MEKKDNVATSAGDERDDLETMRDEETRSQCKALAKTTDKRCKKTALPGLEYCAVHQQHARKRPQQANTERTPLEEEVAKEPQQVPAKKKTEWKQRAGFSVFFDYKMDELGERIWQTRVYDNKSGVEEPLPGIDTAAWVNWILERAKLPVAAEPIGTEIEADVTPTLMTPCDARIEILGVQISQIGPSSGAPEKRLMAEVRFQVSGTEAEKMVADRTPLWIQLHIIDLESEIANLVASKWSKPEPEKFAYKEKLEFPIPELGRYELHSLILLLPPVGRMALHQGPTFKVVP